MTKQEIFDTVATHLLTMPEQAMGPVTCQYRTSNGNACAVGILLTDEEAAIADNAESDVFNLKTKGLLPVRLIPHASMLNALQKVHDNILNWDPDRDGIKIGLMNVANEYGVEFKQ